MLESIFLGMFLLGFLFTVISALMSGALGHAFGEGSAFDAHGAHPGAMGGDVSHAPDAGHAEVGWVGHELSTFSPLSPTTIAAFITAAGGMGYVSLHWWEWSPAASVGLALGSGIVFAVVVFLLFAAIFKVTQGSSLVSLDSTVGMEAEVSIVIPSGQLGEVAYVRNGQRMVMAARCADAASVPAGSKVIVKSVSSTEFVVEETRDSWLARSRGGQARA
jgi:hypothetical protein